MSGWNPELEPDPELTPTMSSGETDGTKASAGLDPPTKKILPYYTQFILSSVVTQVTYLFAYFLLLPIGL